MINTSKVLKNSLWEYEYNKINYWDDIVILRVLNFWKIEDIENTLNHVWKTKIINVFKKNINQINPQIKKFLEIIFQYKRFR